MKRDAAYRIAETRIEEVRRSGAKELHLRNCRSGSLKLTQIPESLSTLSQLQALDVSDNDLSTLPNSLANLRELRSLKLSYNQLTTLPQSLTQLPHLETLDLSHNQMARLPDFIGDFGELQSLDVAGNQLAQLPESLSRLRRLRSLDLSSNQFDRLPDWLGQLAHLHSLKLTSLQLTTVPDWLLQLNQLQILNLGYNRLSTIPDMRSLAALRDLNLRSNPLKVVPSTLQPLGKLEALYLHKCGISILPEWIGELQSLTFLGIGANELTDLPDSFGDLRNLSSLYLGYMADGGNPLGRLPVSLSKLEKLDYFIAVKCKLNHLPEWLGDLSNLRHLGLSENSITDLPGSLARLKHLKILELDNNPLNPELAAASRHGIDAVKRYLRELAKGAKRRYEAKLLILGDGNEGKTCVSRAIRGLPFQPQVTTRGVDVEQWTFEHPDYVDDPNKTITLNIWDFEGQEINHQTHQFFLSTQALYLLVFKCRDQFPMGRAEYWLDTIRARAPQAKVVIVISESEERTPYVPRDKFEEYRDLLADENWLFAVGCKDNSGIRSLQEFIKRSAADLEFMGREWPQSYSTAEEAIKKRANAGIPHISRGQLYDIFRGESIDENIFKDVAGSMSTLGVITQFPDCPDLRDFIVLQPQWLTKAISEIMENRQLESDKGEITLQRMETIWDAKGYSGMFPTFHDCMKEFELCYDLEDASRSCLVPLRFGFGKPTIEWSVGTGMKERRVEYKLNIRPPTGLMSRLIVKTHHMIVTTPEHPKGVYWHNGVFLRTGTGPLASEALCEFDSETRKLRIQVRAAFPQNLLEQIHGYVKAVFSFFSGLEAQRSYGCIKIDERNENEEKCIGVHSESRIYSAIRKQRVLDCEYEFHDVDPQRLIWGFSTFGEYIVAKVASIEKLREELDKRPEWAENLSQDIIKLLSWLDEQRENVQQLINDQANLLPAIKQQLDLKLHEYLAYTSQMLDDRDYAAAPGIISISTKNRSQWNPASYFQKTYILTPFCECEGNIHPCDDGQVTFTKDREWWEKAAPWIARATKLLAAGLQLAFAGMPLVLSPRVFDVIKDDVKFMGELTKHIELETDSKNMSTAADILREASGKHLSGAETESRLMQVALSRFLEETAPTNYRARQWGSLRRVRMSDNSYRWVCQSCRNNLKH